MEAKLIHFIRVFTFPAARYEQPGEDKKPDALNKTRHGCTIFGLVTEGACD
jgi:hypothetical protein